MVPKPSLYILMQVYQNLEWKVCCFTMLLENSTKSLTKMYKNRITNNIILVATSPNSLNINQKETHDSINNQVKVAMT